MTTSVPLSWKKSGRSARYLTDLTDQRSWDALDLPGRREFLAAFWLRRDPDPETLVNEARVQHRLRIEQANARYGRKDLPGYETDRGRVLLVYGEPQEISRDYNSPDHALQLSAAERAGHGSRKESLARDRVNDFEMWTYEGQENAVFVFVDTHGFQQYELVNSTMPSEYTDPRWVRKLYTR